MSKILITIALLLTLTTADDLWLGENHEAGYVKVRDDGSDLFYWMMRSRNDTNIDPLVFWLSGGPGCSSELAVFFENGPWKINDDLTLKKNPFAWNTAANVVYMD
jgi:cathepsin A (carboxypeptidase C)